MKDVRFFKAFGRIERSIRDGGYSVSTAKTDGFGTVESNAAQLKEYINGILAETGKEKVNIIAHSKGGLDGKYMIRNLGMEDKVASLPTLCTPHRGAQLATKLLRLPKFLLAVINFFLNLIYRIFGDRHPNALEVCRQLQVTDIESEALSVSDRVYCQSYSSVLNKADFVMDIPLMFAKRFDKGDSDGMVSVESSKFGNYRGNCTDSSLSHTEVVDFMTRKKKKQMVLEFYRKLCGELCEMGF